MDSRIIDNILNKILEEREKLRVDLIGLPTHIMENRLNTLLALYEKIIIKVLGGFDSRIIYFADIDREKEHIVSISKPLKETKLYTLFQTDIEQNGTYDGLIKPKALFSQIISDQATVGLISLAKPEIYTFPRFALGISDIAHELRNQFKAQVYLFDLQIMTKTKILEMLGELNFDMIGISMTFGLFDTMTDLVSELIIRYPNTKIVIGGSLAVFDYKEVLNLFPNVIVALGEGEKSIPQLLDWTRGNRELREIPDISYIDNGKIIRTASALPMQEMSLPEFDLLIETLVNKGVFQIETSRGCYNACSFCPRQHKGNWRSIIENVENLDYFLQEYTELLNLHGIDPSTQTIYVVDEEFIGYECDLNRKRATEICSLFNKYGLRFEVSFRMNAVFSSMVSKAKEAEILKHINTIHQLGLKRVLIGVESGVDSILERFNKHVTSSENTQGIRLLTALGVPVRFTYITFDPLMTFSELVDTYRYQGRKDLIMNPCKSSGALSLLELNEYDERWNSFSMGIPFYHCIPYMLVSLECLIGSAYYRKMKRLGRLDNETVMALGKKNALYSDWRIGMISKSAQLWIDQIFTLDYTLKSLSKIYPPQKSEKIRAVRTILKDNAYKLLGKFIYLCTGDISLLDGQLEAEVSFAKKLLDTYSSVGKTSVSEEALLHTLTFQKEMLASEMDKVNLILTSVLEPSDNSYYLKQYTNWKNKHEWRFIHAE